MSSENYSRVIREWCDFTQMPVWDAHEDMHFSIDNTIVAFIYDNSASMEVLHVYVDLGHWEQPELYRKLLEDNTPLGHGDSGCFALHPANGRIVYRTQKLMSDGSSASDLLDEVKSIISSAKSRLAQSLS